MTHPTPPKRYSAVDAYYTMWDYNKENLGVGYMLADEALVYANELAKQARLDALEWSRQIAVVMREKGDNDMRTIRDLIGQEIERLGGIVKW